MTARIPLAFISRVIQHHLHGPSASLGETLFTVLLVTAPSFQELRPPANPRRFNRTSESNARNAVVETFATPFLP